MKMKYLVPMTIPITNDERGTPKMLIRSRTIIVRVKLVNGVVDPKGAVKLLINAEVEQKMWSNLLHIAVERGHSNYLNDRASRNVPGQR
jgi:hypothetical protein